MTRKDRISGTSLLKVGLGLILVTVLTACASAPFLPPKPPVAKPPPSVTPSPRPSAPPPAPPPVDLAALQQEISRRKEALQRALGDLTAAPSGEIGPQGGVESSWIQSQQEQLRILEELRNELEGGKPLREADAARRLLRCLALEPLQPPEPPEIRTSLAEETRVSWEEVRTAFAEGRCMEALQRLEALQKDHPEALIPQDVQVIQALCLGRSERRSEAIGVLERLLMSEARLLDTQYLQYVLANWYFEEGLLDRAEKTYTSLLMSSQERGRWAELASVRLEQIRLKREPSEVMASEGSPQPAVSPAEQTSPPPAEIPVSSGQKTPHPGEIPAEGFPPPKEVASAPSILDLRASRLDEARGLLENEQYEEAIAAFQGLLGTEYDAQAQEGIQEAEDRYAQKRRKEAAVLVLKARREGDLGKRKDLLVQAWEILRETVARYPGNRYAGRIRRNMEDVLIQIREIDPSYEPHATLDGPSQTSSSAVQEEP